VEATDRYIGATPSESSSSPEPALRRKIGDSGR
jgi:hypothetical protein